MSAVATSTRLHVAVALWLCAQGGGCAREAPDVVQPIAFNHELHVDKHEIPCTDCHAGAERSARAGLPALPLCLQCHMKPQGDPPSEKEGIVRKLAAERAVIRWVQVTRNPGHVYFSHRAHVGIAKMECAECHGQVDTWKAPPRRPNPRLTDMDACMTCHRERGASNSCRVCHR